MAVLAIAFHNLAVEQEALKLPDEATHSYSEAANIATRELGDAHPVAQSLQATCRAHIGARERLVNARHRAALASARQFSPEVRQAAERRKQASVQRHIEIARTRRSHRGPSGVFSHVSPL